MYLQWIILILILVIAFISDIHTQLIPNWLTTSGVICGLLFHLFNNGLTGLCFALYGLGIAFTLFFILYLLGAIGAGDVKLFAALGAIAGTEFVLHFMVLSIMFAGFIGCILWLLQKQFANRVRWILSSLFYTIVLQKRVFTKNIASGNMTRFPFMWAVLPAAITYFWKGF